MKAVFRSGVLVWILLISGGVLSDSSTDILTTEDWAAETAEARRTGIPIMVLFSTDHCTYCERLKSKVLEPLMKLGELSNLVRFREFNIDRGGKITDFDGEKIRRRIFVNRYEIYSTPTVVLVDYQGKLLGTPIIGFNNREDYTPYLENAVDDAYKILDTIH